MDSRTRMIDSAMAMLGQPYRYGGAAPGGFDCSGLVVYAARQRRNPPAENRAASNCAPDRRCRRSEIRAGDLVFMHLAHKELHVGIAIDAARFVHAPASGGGVRIDSLDAAAVLAPASWRRAADRRTPAAHIRASAAWSRLARRLESGHDRRTFPLADRPRTSS